MAYPRIFSEEQFQDLFATWPNVAPTVRWAASPSEMDRRPFHAIGPNRKTACGLVVPPVFEVAMAAWGDTTCRNCKATWTVS